VWIGPEDAHPTTRGPHQADHHLHQSRFTGAVGSQYSDDPAADGPFAQVSWGQSIGKRMTGIKVVRTDGSPIELWRLILMRNLLMSILGTACNLVSLGDALMIFTQDQRCLHDYLADSIVIDVPKTE
jgi:hypothetical protein